MCNCTSKFAADAAPRNDEMKRRSHNPGSCGAGPGMTETIVRVRTLAQDDFCLNRSVGWLGSPRPACVERSKFAGREFRVRWDLRAFDVSWKQPLTPTLSPQAGRGSDLPCR